MPNVGDFLLEVRRRIPDMPSTNAAPAGFALAAIGTAGSLPAATYYVKLTGRNQWGETTAVAEASQAITGTQSLQITVSLANQPLGLTAIRAYVGLATNQELGFFDATVTAGVATVLTLSALSQLQPAAPPTANSAYIPDSDGQFVSNGSLYSFLNRALDELIRLAGGIIDQTGIQTINAQAEYRIPSRFFQFTNAWFDGFPLGIVQRSMIYLRQNVPGFSGLLSYEADGVQSVIQLWPQSNRTGASTTLATAMGLTDGTAGLTSSAGFLGIGLCQVDNEIMAYSSVSAPQLLGILRGVGGTDIATHAVGAAVTELNLRVSGRRLARIYNPGDSTLTLSVPPGWDVPLALHMMSQVRSMEQDEAAAKELLGQFVASIEAIAKKSRLGQVRPRQIRLGQQEGIETYSVHLGGGWIIA